MSCSRSIAFMILAVLPSSALHAADKSPPALPISTPAVDDGSHHREGPNGNQALVDLKGWTLAGSDAQDYRMGYAAAIASYPKVTARISLKPDANGGGFGTVMQTISAESYRGKRLRFSALLRPQDVESGAGLWFRVDSADGKVLAFDNMQSRPILGTRNWNRYAIVVDVPEGGSRLAYGILLIGKGSVGIDDMQFDVVSKDVATTDMMALPKAPVNLELKQ